MDKTLKLVGKNSNEIFTLRYPTSLLDFCEYDFSYFAKHSIDLCNECLKTGEPDHDRMSELRRDMQSAHCFIEHNIRSTYERIVLDCWLDYICRRDNVGVNALWNRFIRCKTDFEKLVFSRLCDLRYNRAINEWQNIVRVQDYARSKVEFVFADGITTVDEAVSRRNYFDLAFSVTAREMGCRIEDLGVTKTFSAGRVPTAPFLFPNVSKDIVRNLLSDFDYSEDYSEIGDYSAISDKIAMDAFSRMKAGLPQNLSHYGVVRGKMDSYTEKIYMPCSLKAAIDLEIDALIESGQWLGKCRRCGRFFPRDKEHLQEYCSRYVPTGKTCFEIWEEEHPRPTVDEALEKKCREVTDKMYARVDKTLSIKDYEYWFAYMEAMKEKVKNGEISPEELDSFLEYSLDVDISKSTPIVEVPKHEPQQIVPPASRERVVKPFIPERISRKAISQEPQQEEETPRDPEAQRVLKEGFFTSPAKQRSKNERPQISHIIRNGESMGKEEYTKNPDPAGFKPFGQENATPRVSDEDRKRLEEDKRKRRELAEEIARRRELDEEEEARRNAVTPFAEPSFDAPAPEPEKFVPAFEVFSEDKAEESPKISKNISEEIKPREKAPKAPEKKAPEISKPQQPKVIRKNAAAISAYGKAAGAPVVTAPQTDIVIPREKIADKISDAEPESEPFKDIGDIFDVLEQSEDGGSPRRRKARSDSENRQIPDHVTRENAPSGIWTEDRGLFDNESDPYADEVSELDMLKSKKHNKTNKTRRLYDVIMREPDDNPNFRKK
ncbi:MAG: hypothetical protein K2J77_11065 [Oscillospiraceae bacterium]|nr:hypothetical protein [Oscillospiraceae bacterium]